MNNKLDSNSIIISVAFHLILAVAIFSSYYDSYIPAKFIVFGAHSKKAIRAYYKGTPPQRHSSSHKAASASQPKPKPKPKTVALKKPKKRKKKRARKTKKKAVAKKKQKKLPVKKQKKKPKKQITKRK